ncbi:MAG: hypothetical protein A2Y41_04510 [Spirochaetes bacterium GWB1_36_13]|nr:MAG: hypothetical protein A2Y41_04510 [Spirochaetes bacterium GWB1_36_13]
MRKTLLVSLFLFLAAGILSAKDIYVSAGAKSGDGNKNAPYNTISDALSTAFAGDVIHVSEGIYYGDGGGGLFLIKINNLTLAGGYNKDFSTRNPFKHKTILMRGVGNKSDSFDECSGRDHKKWHSMTPTKASYNGEAIVYGVGDHSNFILDGFFIDGHTRQTYKKNGDLKTDIGPITSPLVSLKSPGVKVRNCVVLNSGGFGIRVAASGKKDDPASMVEISNNIIVNTLMGALELRVGDFDPTNNPNGGLAVIKNNTIAFVWDWLGEGYGLLVGRQTKLTVEKNIFAFANLTAINNGFQNKFLKLVENVFWNNMEGVYKYWSPESKLTLIEDNVNKFGGKLAGKLALSKKSEKNVAIDPKFAKIDKDFFEKFSNQIKSTGGGKVEWDSVNQWRSSMGLPLVGSKGTGNKNFAPIYELEDAVLISKESSIKGIGAQIDGPFEAYSSKTESVEKTYQDASFDSMLANSALDQKDISVKVKIEGKGSSGDFWKKDAAPDSKYICFKLGKYPNSSFVYVLKGSEALKTIEEALKLKLEVKISGTAYSIKDTYKKDRVCIVADSAEMEEDE